MNNCRYVVKWHILRLWDFFKGIIYGITVFKFFIWGGIEYDIRSEISFTATRVIGNSETVGLATLNPEILHEY